MNNTVLATKWRPKSFSDLVGQEPIVKALANSLDNNRIHHSYLLTGTRGVGKTTLARILAKCLNCETKGVSSDPCSECISCESIDQGQFVDLYEIDAASRTKVEDTRELLENVQYMPTQGRFKIYLIDEVHMLSTHSFNALLKTLEEPPSHVKFILATTDYQKIPSTILSRCLHFGLNRISVKTISDQLTKILLDENVTFEKEAIENISRLADGSMRDALSLAEQSISHGDNKITYENICKILCLTPADNINKLCEMIIQEDIKSLMIFIDKIYYESADFKYLLEEIISILHQTAIYKVTNLIKDSVYEKSILAFSEKLNEENIQTLYQICTSSLKDLEYAPDYKSGFEMTIIRMILFSPFQFNSKKMQEKFSKDELQEKKNKVDSKKKIEPVEEKEKKYIGSQTSEDIGSKWETIVSRLEIDSITKNLAKNIMFNSNQGSNYHFLINEDLKNVATEKSIAKLQEALSNFLGKEIFIKLNLSENNLNTINKTQEANYNDKIKLAEKEIDNDAFVKAIKDKFEAKSIDNSIKINEKSKGD